MTDVFRKLNLKDQREIVVLNAPESFESDLSSLREVSVRRDLDGAGRIGFALAFVIRQDELDGLAKAIAGNLEGDAVLWFAYPKASSKRYRCEFNRDTGWDVLGRLGFEGVRQVAIDEDWSALRFRRVEFIKKMVRDERRARTEDGKRRARNPGP